MKPNINLDFHAEGDLDFKRRLAALLILSVKELQQALEHSLSQKDPDVFKRACHKERTTMDILGNSDFLKLTLDITACISKPNEFPSLKKQLPLFNNFCQQGIKELEKEARS